jgi:hypothetical protein
VFVIAQSVAQKEANGTGDTIEFETHILDAYKVPTQVFPDTLKVPVILALLVALKLLTYVVQLDVAVMLLPNILTVSTLSSFMP